MIENRKEWDSRRINYSAYQSPKWLHSVMRMAHLHLRTWLLPSTVKHADWCWNCTGSRRKATIDTLCSNHFHSLIRVSVFAIGVLIYSPANKLHLETIMPRLWARAKLIILFEWDSIELLASWDHKLSHIPFDFRYMRKYLNGDSVERSRSFWTMKQVLNALLSVVS